VLAALDEMAARLKATPAQLALAWQMRQPGIAAPIASATSLAQWAELRAAAQLALSDADLSTLSAASQE
jgi:aryl-alcohol dehydrogenase-like predicted oxidoreductase